MRLYAMRRAVKTSWFFSFLHCGLEACSANGSISVCVELTRTHCSHVPLVVHACGAYAPSLMIWFVISTCSGGVGEDFTSLGDVWKANRDIPSVSRCVEDKKLSCRREAARCFVSLNISL